MIRWIKCWLESSAGVYKLKGTLPNLVNPRKKFIHMKSRKIDKENDSEAVWLSEKEEKSMPKFDYILDMGNSDLIYLGALGKSKVYVGMIFVDGSPIKVDGNYSFFWRQKPNEIISKKISVNSAKSNVVFAYMYEQGGDVDSSYVTDKYKIQP